MGIYFSDVVDQAIEAIYYCYDSERATAVIQPLLDAAKAGDGDASYILSRCLSGNCYSWHYHPFREDEEGANFFIVQSIRQGSAMGVLGAMRCGMLTPEMEEIMPFPNLKAAWDVVYEKAEAGCLFCQNMIGNTYFWGDMIRIEGKGPDTFPSHEDFQAYVRELTLASVPWFEKAFYGGMGFAGRNLCNLYTRGEEDTGIPPQPEKALEVRQKGAELGYPDWQSAYGEALYGQKQYAEAVKWLTKAVDGGHLEACFSLGRAYLRGEGVDRDLDKCVHLWEQGASWPSDRVTSEMVGYYYISGDEGFPVDYARGEQLLEKAASLGSFWQGGVLAYCLVTGKGCQKDYAKAKVALEQTPENRRFEHWNYAYGLMLAEGLGVPQDIKAGVEYLQKSTLPEAGEALTHYKKNLFGRWVRR